MEITDSSRKVLLILLKQFNLQHTVTTLANALRMTRPGVFKMIKNLENDKLVTVTPVGRGKTNTTIIKINWENPLIEKVLALFLASEANEQARWQNTFKSIENITDFCILFGSILHDQKNANDIDFLCILGNKKDFLLFEKNMLDIQKSQIKKIHAIPLMSAEFTRELKNDNRAYIDAIQKGIVLFGQEKFIQFIQKVDVL